LLGLVGRLTVQLSVGRFHDHPPVKGVKRGGELWEWSAFYESNVGGSSLLYDSLPF
jgi:hypothetical protein